MDLLILVTIAVAAGVLRLGGFLGGPLIARMVGGIAPVVCTIATRTHDNDGGNERRKNAAG
jgi:hypothetical protein